MNNKVNFAFVGGVVLSVIIAMIVAIYWLVRPADKNQMKEYMVYFNESVSGLNINAPVKYRGVNVGKVEKISISHINNIEIEVLVSISADTPIKTSTRATLNAQGITGLVFIDLSVGDATSPDLVKLDTQRYPVIESNPSLLKRFESSIGGVTEKLSGTLDGANKLLNDENQKNIAITLAQSQEFMSRINKVLDDQSIEHLHNTLANLDIISTQLNKDVLPKISTLASKGSDFSDKVSVSMVSVAQSYLVIQASMAEFQRAIAGGEFNLKDITKDTVGHLNGSLETIQEAMIELQTVLKMYEDSPNDMLFKKEKRKKGPGE